MKFKGHSRTTGRWFSLMALVVGGMVSAQETKEPRMLVLELQVTAGGVSLLGSTNVAGHCKPQPDVASGIEYQVRSTDAAILRKGVVSNPLLRRFCSEETPGSGVIRTQFVEQEEGYVVIRVPADEAAAAIRFYERPPQDTRALSSTPRLLGEISLR